MTQESSLLPYEDIAFPTPTEGQSVMISEAGFVISGICPRCQHPTDCSVPIGVITPGVTGIGTQNVEVKSGTYETVITCRCNYPHPSRPTADVGCGAFWRIAIEV